jgi:hypothetical protein
MSGLISASAMKMRLRKRLHRTYWRARKRLRQKGCLSHLPVISWMNMPKLTCPGLMRLSMVTVPSETKARLELNGKESEQVGNGVARCHMLVGRPRSPKDSCGQTEPRARVSRPLFGPRLEIFQHQTIGIPDAHVAAKRDRNRVMKYLGTTLLEPGNKFIKRVDVEDRLYIANVG